LDLDLERLAAPVPVWHGRVALDDWQEAAIAVRQAGGRLISLWGSDRAGGHAVCAAYAVNDGLVWLELPLAGGQTAYPDLSTIFAAALRMQRAAAEL